MRTANVQASLRTSLAVSALALGLAAGAAAEPVGFVALAEGQVEIRPGGAASFEAVAVDREISVGDTIRTGRASLAKLVFEDDTVLTVDEETELEIDHYVTGSGATSEPSRIDLVAGHLRTKVGEAFGGTTRLQVHTPTAVIGVKGTEWLTWYLAQLKTTFACVISGVVTLESADPSVTGSYEPPIDGCARVLPHARPEPAELPAEITSVDAARSAVPVSAPTPAVATGPGGDEIEVPTGRDTSPPIQDALDAASIGGVDAQSAVPPQPPPQAPPEPPPTAGGGFPGPGGGGSGGGGFPIP